MSVVYSSDLDSVTNNTTPPGWTALVGVLVAQTAANGARPVSGTKACLSQATDGNRAVYTGISALADVEFQSSHKVHIASSDAALMHHLLRADSTFANGYRVALVYSGGNYTAVLLKKVAGTTTNLGAGSGSAFAVTHGDTVLMATRIVGSTIDLYLWKSTGSRPGSPTYTWTDTAISAAGYVGLWNSPGGTFVSGSFDDFAIDDLASGDTTAPSLTSPTGTQTGSTTASGTVSTDEANGTLYYLASTNATETAATVKAASGQTVTVTGSQAVSFTGLTASTTYYAHYCHRDAAGNDSTVANSASFTTAAAASTYAPNINKPRSGMGVNFYGAR